MVLAQHFEQVRAGADFERAGNRVNVQVHRGLFFAPAQETGLSLERMMRGECKLTNRIR